MKSRPMRLIWLPLLLLAFAAKAQNHPLAHAATQQRRASSASAASVPLARYSKEPYVIEKYTTKFQYGGDGLQTRTVLARVHIQSAVAAQKFSQLSFEYDSTEETLQFRSVQILAQDGSRKNIPTETATNGTATVAVDAPAYSAYRAKSIAIPNLQPGDTLEYEIASHSNHPEPNGPFWLQYTFLADAIVLAETLEIDVPNSRHVALKSPRVPYSTDATSSPGRIVYRWKHANLALKPEGEQPNGTPQRLQPKPVDAMLTTFADWGTVAKWYSKITQVQAEPSPEVLAKAAELTRDRASDSEKIRALFNYVSRNLRYVDLPFAAAAQETHSAAQVLGQNYATSVDKRIVLAALLEAAGIRSQTALLSDSSTMDASLPSPAQFTRVLTVIPQGNHLVWLDPSPGVAPFEFVPASLRNKPALLVSSDGGAKLATTPADPPFPSTQRVEIEGQVSDLGKLTARIRYELRGDNEYVLRLAFHRTPEKEWKNMAQTILTLDGLNGEVSSAHPSDPVETDNPFALDIEYSQPGFLDWSSERQRVPIPLLTLGLPDAPKKEVSSIELGTPLHVTAQLQLSLPPGFLARPPAAISVSREYADFQSSYHFGDHLLTAERSLDFKVRALPSSQAGDYLAFSHAVAADQAQPLLVENSAGDLIPPSASPAGLFEAGVAALASGNTRSSIPLFERLVQLDPTYKEAWNKLGLSYMRAKQFELASTAFKKQIEADPADPQAHNYLGLAFEQQHKYDEAADAFLGQVALDPLDKLAHEAMGTVYLAQHEYEKAIPELEKAAVLSPEKPEIQLSLGEAYANLAQTDLALSCFQKAVALSPSPAISNAVARSLADHKLALGQAQKYAESAVASAAASIQGLDLAHASAEEFGAEAKLASYWGTLGWLHFQQQEFDAAERYIRAAWLLNQTGEIASHLAQTYEKRGNKDEAVHTYALALAAKDADPEAKARLTLLLGGNSQIPDLVDHARPVLESMLSFPAGKFAGATAKAEFLVLLSPASGKHASSKASASRFVAGSEELRPFANRLLLLDFGPIFPDASATKLIRRGTLACSSTSAECTFTLLPLESIDSQPGD